MEESNKWHYKTLSKFKEDYYEGLILENMSCGDRMYIEKVKWSNPDVNEVEDIDLEEFFFPYRDGKDIYLIPHDYVKHLPIKVNKSKFVAYNKAGYILAEDVTKMKIVDEKIIPYTEIIDKFAKFDCTNNDEDELIRLIALVSYIDRVNVAVAGRKASGKTSRFQILENLMGNVTSIGKPTFAKLKHELGNRVIVINEVNGMSSNTKEDIEMFFLDAGDGKESYTNNSRASKGTTETFNISKLSLVLLFNTFKEMGYRKSKFFHTMWDNEAVPDRFLPIEIQSSLKTKFTSVFDIPLAAKQNKQFYIDLVKTIRYLRNDRPVRKFKDEIDYIFEDNRDRWEANFRILVYWIDIFSKTQDEFNRRVKTLYKCHMRYMLSLNGEEFNPTINVVPNEKVELTLQQSVNGNKTVSSYNDVVPKLKEYLTTNGKTNIKVLLEKGFSGEAILKAKRNGDIMEISKNIYEVL